MRHRGFLAAMPRPTLPAFNSPLAIQINTVFARTPNRWHRSLTVKVVPVSRAPRHSKGAARPMIRPGLFESLNLG